MTRRPLSREDRRLWARVERTLDRPRRVPDPVQAADPMPSLPPEPKSPPRFVKPPKPVPAPRPPVVPSPASGGHAAPQALEPRRHRRLARERDPIEARIDLHGLSRFEAQDALTAFLVQAHARGYRAVLVVTGKGSRGTPGIIRSSISDWIAHPPLRAVVAGVAAAHRRHGGEGAIYLTLRRPG